MELLGKGRDADVYALDEKRVLRRYRRHDVSETEARVMNHVRANGFPAPLVHDVSGTDMVMERLHGTTLTAALFRGDRDPGVLADLHNRLHALAAPDWLPRHRGGGDRVVHFDLHPDNVILTGDGPFVIDWTVAAAADPALDVADTLVVLRVAAPDGVEAAVLDPLRERLVGGFLAGVDADPAPRLAEAIQRRLGDANLLPAEGERLRRWLDQPGGPTP